MIRNEKEDGGEHPDLIFEKLIDGKTKESAEEEHIKKIINIFEGFIQDKYKEIKENHKLNVSQKRKVWRIEQREFYYTRIYIDLCNALRLISSGPEEDEIFSEKKDQINFSQDAIKNRKLLKESFYESIIYPYLVESLKEKASNRKESIIKCILNTLVNFIFTGKKDDNKIPLYYSYMCINEVFEESNYLESAFSLFFRIFKDFFQDSEKRNSSLKLIMGKFKCKKGEEDLIKLYHEELKGFENKIVCFFKKCNMPEALDTIYELREFLNSFRQNMRFTDLYLEENIRNFKETLDDILIHKDKVLYYFDNKNYQKYITALSVVIENYLIDKVDIWEFFFMIDNMIDLKYTNEEEINYFNEIKENSNFQQFFKDVLNSRCIKTYYNMYEDISRLYDEQFAIKIYESFYKELNLVPLPPGINGFTDCCLLTFINNRKRKYKFFNYIKAEELFKCASFLVTLLHESNHYIRRYTNMSENSEDAHTSDLFYTEKGRIENKSKPKEGGALMSENLFGVNLITLNIFQVLFLMNSKNWDQECDEFKKNFQACNNSIYIDKSVHNLKIFLKGDFEDEIIMLVKEAEKSDHRKRSQIVYQKVNVETEFDGMVIGRCLIEIGRQNDKNYNL